MKWFPVAGLALPPGDRRSAIDGEPLALHHKTRIEALLAQSAAPFSECSFSNMYLFRVVHDYRFVDGDEPHVLGITYDGVRHAIPLIRSIEGFERGGWPEADCLFPVQDVAERNLAAARWNDDDSDYLYDTELLASLAGAALKPKRQQARAYAERWRPSLLLDSANFVSEATAMLDCWLKQVGKRPEYTDYAVCLEAIGLASSLGLECALLTSGADSHGFLMTSVLPDGSKAVHFAKARRDLPGAYPFLFSSYATVAGTRTLNFEQDLGKAGFRQAKRALGPRGQLRKYRVFRGSMKC